MRHWVCKYLIALALAIVSNYAAYAETDGVGLSQLSDNSILPDSVIASHQHFKISYHLNRYEIDTAYMANRENIRRMRISLSNPLGIDSIVIYSFASPEGPLQNNIRLARMRGKTAGNLIRQIIAEKNIDIEEEKIKLRVRGENWEDLHTIVSKTYHGDDRDELLAILNSSMPQEQKKREIKKLGRKTWRFIIDELMPHLRSSEIVCIYHSDFIMSRLDYKTAEILQVPVAPRVHTGALADVMGREPEFSTEKRTRVAVKTNMLYDALMWTNYGVEVPFKIKEQQLSVTFDHQFSWWRWGKNNNEYSNRYFQIGGEARWWFAPQTEPKTKKKITRDCLAGHFIGAYFVSGKYDFQWQRKICYQGEFWSTGVTYGYAMPISRLFNIEFSVSAGFAPITYRHYFPADDYSILFIDRSKMGTKNYIGITKAAISLVMPLKFKQKITHRKKIRL